MSKSIEDLDRLIEFKKKEISALESRVVAGVNLDFVQIRFIKKNLDNLEKELRALKRKHQKMEIGELK